MIYQYEGKDCPNAPAGTTCNCIHEVNFKIGKAPSIGTKRNCPMKGCNRKVVRILSTGIQGIVKGSIHDWKPGETMRMRMNGQDVGFSFIDHKHTDPAYQRNLATMAGKAGMSGNVTGLSNARYDEKLGRMVVDVASNVADPLGKFERAKKGSDYKQTKYNVKQPYKVRKSATK